MLVSEAAKLLGLSTKTLRLALQQDKYPEFGRAIKTSENRYTYYINPKRLHIFLEGGDMNVAQTINKTLVTNVDNSITDAGSTLCV